MIAKSQQWQFSAVALAVLLGLWGSDASALSLGRITVQSALGEPLKAEVDVLDINADEAASLVIRVATPEAFKAAGLEYNPAMSSLKLALQRRADGKAYILLSGDRAISDPFVDMILETRWNTGRIVRDYTLLFDPPSLRDANRAVVAPNATPTAPVVAAQATGPAPAPAIRQVPAQPASPPQAVAQPAPRPPPPQAATIAPAPVASGQSLTVRAGDTAGGIAAANKPASVSLDQMLVALLRANPSAFINSNINRIKAGVVVDLPTAEQANSVSAQEARGLIIAQSQDFNAFRRKFATNVPSAEQTPASRQASGPVQTEVQEKKPAAAAADKLTLSKGALQTKNTEEQLARERNAREAASRSAELSKNISDLSKLAAATQASVTASASSSAPPKPALATVVTTPVASAPVVAVSAPASAATVASSPTAPVSKPKKPVLIPPEPLPEPGFVDALLENPLLPAGAAALLALLGGFALYRMRQRKKKLDPDAETRLPEQAESFLGASGGQSVDTSDSLANGSSMVYSPSQLDAVDEVDPVAEADVYMAYGRDLQAEEILKDALRSNPQRLAIHHKLLEIYAKRGDAKSFEAIATQAFNLTDGSGADWEQVCEKGLKIDPDNALYLPGGQPYARPSPLTGAAPLDGGPATIPVMPESLPPRPSGASSFVDLDLDLDFSDEPTPASASPEPPAQSPVLPDLSTDLELPDLADLPIEPSLPTSGASQGANEPAPEPDLALDGLDFSLPTLPESAGEPDLSLASKAEPQASAPSASAPSKDLMEFDLGSLALDMGDEPVTVAGALPSDGQDPLETKLALAEEFLAIGDDDGARALIEEVIAEATGDVKSKAQRALEKL